MHDFYILYKSKQWQYQFVSKDSLQDPPIHFPEPWLRAFSTISQKIIPCLYQHCALTRNLFKNDTFIVTRPIEEANCITRAPYAVFSDPLMQVAGFIHICSLSNATVRQRCHDPRSDLVAIIDFESRRYNSNCSYLHTSILLDIPAANGG